MGHGLIRKGVGHVALFDFDTVDPTNLPRQHFFLKDLGKPKAKALAHNLLPQATASSQIDGYVTSFQDAMNANLPIDGDVVVVGVDNNATRIAAAEYYHDKGIPVVFLAVDVQATRGYVFVQTSQPDDPCFQCLFPDAATDQRVFGCAGASIEILKTMAGVALYAIDSLLMERPRHWNYKAVFLDQGGDGVRMIGQRENCPLCSSSNDTSTR